jgi:hypothetical protein
MGGEPLGSSSLLKEFPAFGNVADDASPRDSHQPTCDRARTWLVEAHRPVALAQARHRVSPLPRRCLSIERCRLSGTSSRFRYVHLRGSDLPRKAVPLDTTRGRNRGAFPQDSALQPRSDHQNETAATFRPESIARRVALASALRWGTRTPTDHGAILPRTVPPSAVADWMAGFAPGRAGGHFHRGTRVPQSGPMSRTRAPLSTRFLPFRADMARPLHPKPEPRESPQRAHRLSPAISPRASAPAPCQATTRFVHQLIVVPQA